MYRYASNRALVERFPEPADDQGRDGLPPQPLGVIELLKDQFGDYSDPLIYDWSWWDTD